MESEFLRMESEFLRENDENFFKATEIFFHLKNVKSVVGLWRFSKDDIGSEMESARYRIGMESEFYRIGMKSERNRNEIGME